MESCTVIPTISIFMFIFLISGYGCSVCVPHVCPQRPEEATEAPGIGATNGWGLPCGPKNQIWFLWKINQCSFQPDIYRDRGREGAQVHIHDCARHMGSDQKTCRTLLSLRHADFGADAQLGRFGGECLHLLSHVTCSSRPDFGAFLSPQRSSFL